MIRPVAKLWKSRPTIEGAGVHLRRGFGFHETNLVDPFLLFDDFRNENPEDYRAGFPWHPHRGIETITYVLDGDVEHGDSLGHQGVIGSGDVQWMTAGRGIVHQEMPKGDGRGRMFGFQLWSNLPAASKMTEPRYREAKAAEMPVVKTPSGALVRVVAGTFDGHEGPIRGVQSGPEYLDVSMPSDSAFAHEVASDRTVFAYVFEGAASFAGEKPADDGTVLLFGPGSRVEATTGKGPSRFLLVSGTPLREPIAWYGPIVMNTQDELKAAFAEIKAGTFATRGP